MLAGLFLALLYTGFYLADPALPGNQLDPCCVKGWLGWGDQGFYYQSLAALAKGDLDPSHHWYPLGYSLLAVPFTFLRNNAFFPVDLASLLITYGAFLVFARRVGVSTPAAVIVFLLTVCADPLLFEQWAIPWNTSPSAALIWSLLAVAAVYLQGGHLRGTRKPLLLGALAGGLPLIRPTDALISGIVLLWLLADDIKNGHANWRDFASLAVGGGSPIAAYGLLHAAIYGWHETTYMTNSQWIGFTAHNPVWRAYVLLIEPRQWFFFGRGLLARMPWLLLGLAGSLWVWRGRGPAALLSTCLLAYCLLFLSYVDLLPTGLWRYFNVHYFKWTLPGFGLLAWILIQALRRRSRSAWGVLALVLLVSCIRVMPRLARADEPAVAVDMPGPRATEANTTFSVSLAVTDSIGTAQSVATMRAFPLPGGDGVRFIAIRRDFLGALAWEPDHALPTPPEPGPQRRWAEHIGIGYPCWLPPYVCKRA